MKREDFLSLVRHIMSAAGGFLVIKGIDNNLILQGSGLVIAIISMIWSFKDKVATIDGVQGVLRQIATFVGGIFIAKGKLSITALDSYLGIISAFIPFILSRLGIKSSDVVTTAELATTTK